jgi:hypothetical protein
MKIEERLTVLKAAGCSFTEGRSRKLRIQAKTAREETTKRKTGVVIQPRQW